MKPTIRSLSLLVPLAPLLLAAPAGAQQPAAPDPAQTVAPTCACPCPAEGAGAAAGPHEHGAAGQGGTTGGQGGGMMGGQGGMMGGCPMMGGGAAQVTVEATPTGAVLHVSATHPGQVEQVRAMAQHMATCMGAPAPTPGS